MFRSIVLAATLAVLCIASASVDANPDLMNKLVKTYSDNTKKRLPPQGACRADNLAVRKEW